MTRNLQLKRFQKTLQVGLIGCIALLCSSMQELKGGSIRHLNFDHPKIARQIKHSANASDQPVKFEVADVKIAEQLLPEHESKKVFEQKLGKEILYLPQEHADQNYVYSDNNIFIQTIHQSFDQHRPLLLSPDIIWLTICQGIAIHINENFDSLETLIFKTNKPKELVVRNDSLEKNGEQWTKLITALSEETSKHVNADYRSFFVPQFSTTTSIEKTAYEITLMNSFKKAFTYTGESGCGIPSITLTGNKEDWMLIKLRLNMLDQLGLADWRLELESILTEFIRVFDGEINLKFWNDLYKNMTDYNAFYISGWVLKFFPYITQRTSTDQYDDETGMLQMETKYIQNPFLKGDQYLLSTLSTADIPSGIVDIDIRWNNYFTNSSSIMAVYAGFFAIKQHPDKTLEPLISWAICEQNAKEITHNFPWTARPVVAHKSDYWAPKIVTDLTQQAIFMPKKFKDHNAGMEHLKAILRDSVDTHFGEDNLSGSSLSFVVLTNGHVENVTFSGEKNIGLYLESVLKQFNGDWMPGWALASNVYEMWEPLYGDPVKIKVNSTVQVIF